MNCEWIPNKRTSTLQNDTAIFIAENHKFESLLQKTKVAGQNI
jgi:hypothetical protein